MAKTRATAKRPAGKAKRKVGKKRKRKAPGTSNPRLRSRAVAPTVCAIDLITAGEIVQDAVPHGPHNIDSTLEDAGLITGSQRTVFRADVVDGVSARGCTIAADDVPNAATTTLRQARTAVQQNAH